MTTQITVGSNVQYLRKCAVIVSDSSDPNTAKNAREFNENLHITFQTQQSDFSSPNYAVITIYNLSNDTMQAVDKEFSTIRLQAGYLNGPYGVIFQGTIKQVRRGRISPTDTYLAILAGDGDEGYCWGKVNKTIYRNAKQESVVKEVQDKLLTEQGYQDFITPGVLSRPKVMFGMARNYMDDLAETSGNLWSIQQGKLQSYKRTSYVPGQATVLTGQTGMIGLPVQTEGGIMVRALINPNLRVGQLVEIKDSSIQRAFLSPNWLFAKGRLEGTLGDIPTLANPQVTTNRKIIDALLPPIANDGRYRIYVAEHIGDTRSQEWYVDMTCIAVNSAASSDTAVKAATG